MLFIDVDMERQSYRPLGDSDQFSENVCLKRKEVRQEERKNSNIVPLLQVCKQQNSCFSLAITFCQLVKNIPHRWNLMIKILYKHHIGEECVSTRGLRILLCFVSTGVKQ